MANSCDLVTLLAQDYDTQNRSLLLTDLSNLASNAQICVGRRAKKQKQTPNTVEGCLHSLHPPKRLARREAFPMTNNIIEIEILER